jgi:hypothetical protein
MKITKLLMLFVLNITLTCCTNFKGYIKKSANEEVFDTKGFRGKKRMPMYNSKYIQKAKDNLASGDIDDDHQDSDEHDNLYYDSNELADYNETNRRMYQDMVEMNHSKRNLNYKRNYPKLSHIDKQYQEKQRQDELNEEIKSIKKILEETREKLSNQKCTTDASDVLLPTNKSSSREDFFNENQRAAGAIPATQNKFWQSKLWQSEKCNSKIQQCR